MKQVYLAIIAIPVLLFLTGNRLPGYAVQGVFVGKSPCSSIARKTSRPILPKPLMPIFTIWYEKSVNIVVFETEEVHRFLSGPSTQFIVGSW